MINSNSIKTDYIFIVIASIAGVLSIVLPYLVIYGYEEGELYASPLFPLLRSAWEKLNIVFTPLILVAVGAILGYLRPHRWLVIGASAMLLLPVATIAEILISPTTHNLWPLEFLLYLTLVSGPAVFGSYIGRVVHRHINAT